ncbi:hypothetical protein EM868_04310 [Cupriavidus gilardii]|uniref:hypothetical protein n=1 Tax=Cupriavidus gilardii TaxID=82541 RepID=UPI001EE536FA|nr:hypothetical protein [Cupriavidus gilardii]MCG5258860.1 hypothetical protein [Cupriavidus gilardii]MDF9429022.1 hypothetical protein [Cupriavidus gilardii]
MGKQDAARMTPPRSRARVAATLPGGGLRAPRADRADRAGRAGPADDARGAAAAAPVRERLLSPACAAGFVAAAAICLALMFPREPLRDRLLREALHAGRTMDGPTLDYLKAWLRVSPPDARLVAELAERYAGEARLDEADALLARMEPSVTDEAALPMLRARLDIARQRANAATSDMPARERYRSELRTLLRQAARMPAPPSDLIAFAAQARALGADDLELAFYHALACPQPSHAAFAGHRHAVAPVRSEWREFGESRESRDEGQRRPRVRG